MSNVRPFGSSDPEDESELPSLLLNVSEDENEGPPDDEEKLPLPDVVSAFDLVFRETPLLLYYTDSTLDYVLMSLVLDLACFFL